MLTPNTGDCAGLVRAQYYGTFIGPLTDNVASVGGAVFAVDQTSVLVTNFTHDGSDPGDSRYSRYGRVDNIYISRNVHLRRHSEPRWLLHQDRLPADQRAGHVSRTS